MARFSAQEPTGAVVQQLEVLVRTAIFKPANALVAFLLQAAADRLDAGYQPRLGEHWKGRETLQVQGMFGAFPLERDYYCHPGKKQGHYPADAALGLEVAYMPALARLLCLEGADEMGYDKAQQHMAETGGIHVSARPIWQANDLKPHRMRTFKLSRDPQFEAKFWDVIGLYLDPPQKALVLCCDEKSQCQALERSQPGLPLGIGHIRTRTHDYVRHGTTTLFAALNSLDGRVIARTETRHTHVEWLRFLRQIERETPPELTLHLIVDNYATHKHPAVRAWLARHPRVRQHFTPTSSSWLNLVERFFRDLTQEVVREGNFQSVGELVRTIEVWLAQRNRQPQRYVWRAEGSAILKKITRARAILEETKADNSRTAH